MISNRLKKYDNPSEFLNETSPYLKKGETKNNFCFGLSYAFCSKPDLHLILPALKVFIHLNLRTYGTSQSLEE